MTDYEVARETSQILKMSEETNTPQRSILDFFKTPPKNLTTKPKDLLGFFCKKESNSKTTLGISCNGKDTSTKENESKKKLIRNEGKSLKKRKRTISKEELDDDVEDDGEKAAPRNNMLKRKKGKTTGAKVCQKKVGGDRVCETERKTDLQSEGREENASETSNKEKGIDEDRVSEAPLRIHCEEIPNSCVSDQVNKPKETSARGLCTPLKGSTEERDEDGGEKGTQGAPVNLEWNKRIDIEKCRTPKEKTQDKSARKKNKLKKRKKESDSRETVSKSLNLSDICTNMADVSILSDGGINTSHILNDDAGIGNDNIKENENNKETNVTEVSFEVFLSKAAHVKDDREDDLDETDGIVKEMTQKTRHCMKEDQPRTEFADIDEEGPGMKKRGRPRKSSPPSDTVQKEAVSRDQGMNEKLEESETVKEVSYLDYLNTINTTGREVVTNKGSQGENSQKQNVEVVSSPSVEVGTDIPMPKHYPSITNFFSKVGSDKKWQPAPPKSRNNVSYIKAVIHEPPSDRREKKEEMEIKQVAKKTNRSLKKHRSEETIEVLSSEIIVLDDIPVNVKGKDGRNTEVKKQPEELKLKPDTKVLTEQEEAEKEKKNLFLHGVDTNDKTVKQKTSQATLSFTKGGLHMSKSVKEPVEKSSEKSTAESTSTPEPERRKRGRPKGSVKNGIKETTQDSPTLSSPNLSQVFEEGSDKGNKSSASLAERRKSLRQKYKVKLLQNQEPESPIRMKFIRCLMSSSGSSQDESLTPKSKEKAKIQTQSKAQQLLEKAKRIQEAKKKSQGKKRQKAADPNSKGSRKKQTKGRGTAEDEVIEVKSDSETGESGGRRRSSRLSDRQRSMKELEVVELDNDEETNDSCYTPTKPNRRAGCQKQGAAKKPEVKNIAPIFLKKKSNAVNSPVKRELDPEAEKLKRAFLMSGIPAELKQSPTIVASSAIALYPPFPRDNHIQQRSSSKMWSVENIILKTVAGVEFCSKITQMWSLNPKAGQPVMSCQIIPIPLQSEKLKENVISCLLKEISQSCPSFPTQKMYSILKEKQDEEVIEETEGRSKGKESKEKEEKEKPRRSLRRRKEVIEIIDVGGSPESKLNPDKKEDKLENVLPALSWPEKYQPFHSSEIIGNLAVIKRLRAWLLEWKQCLDKEAKRAKLMLMKEKKKPHKEEEVEEEWWADDASDFDLDSDSEGEGDRLCNTAMLTGPLGVGKTASVYALAQELGFKVFEVNASSSRNGKRILAQLQEATQSQQVSKHHFSGAGTPKKHKNNTNMDVPSEPKPTFFTNLFKKAGHQPTTSSHSTEVKEKGVRKKRKLEEDAEYRAEKEPKRRKKGEDGAKTAPPQEKRKSLNLSCTSLILFDEVDLVFEAFDKGFWAAVKNFMDTTKIPIILTSNDCSLPLKFEGRFEQYKFRVPPIIPTSCYLRLVALTENIRMDWDEIVNLVSIFNCDIRRVLLTLQLWVNSGGGQKVLRSVKERETPQEIFTNLPVIDENSCSQDMLAVSKRATRTDVGTVNDDDDDDFVSIKPITCKRQQVVRDEESSNLAPPSSEKVLMEAQKCPSVNVSCLESMLGLPIKNENGILCFLNKTLQDGRGRDEELAVLACQQYLKLKVDLLYGHHLDMLPLNKVTVEHIGPKIKAPSPVKTKRRRIKMTSDLYDSEGSDNESTDVAPTSPIEQKTAKRTQREENSLELIRALGGFADFYDNISFTDTMSSLEERILGDRNSEYGMTEDPLIHEHSELWMQDHLSELCGTVRWTSLSALAHRLKEVTQGLVQDERFTVPVLKGRTSTLTQGLACPDTRSQSTMDKAYSNVLSSLPLSVQSTKGPVMCDYLPYLRSITRDEQIRQAAKLKRRFHHYFDQIGLSLKDQTLEILNLPLS